MRTKQGSYTPDAGERPHSDTGPVKPHVSFVAVTMPIVMLFLGVLFFVVSATAGPWYFGSSEVTTGTIVSSPTSHPDVTYTVDGVSYTLHTRDNNPGWTLGEQIGIAYNPRNPAQAGTTGDRLIVIVFAAFGTACLLAGLVWGAVSLHRRHRARSAAAYGQRVEAAVTAVSQNTAVHMGAKVMTKVTCQWTGPDRVEHTFHSEGKFLPLGTTLATLPVTTLPVYVDPDEPTRYYVDDSALA